MKISQDMIFSQGKNKCNSIKIFEKLKSKVDSFLKKLEREDLMKLYIGLKMQKIQIK